MVPYFTFYEIYGASIEAFVKTFVRNAFLGSDVDFLECKLHYVTYGTTELYHKFKHQI